MTASSGGFFSSVPSVSRQLQIVSITLLFAVSTCVAQQGAPAAEPPDSSGTQESTNPGSQPTNITIPAGTHVALALTHPVDSHSTRRGDEIFAQTTSPLIVSNQVAIPAGTFVQGKVDKMTRRGSRGELQMQSVSVVFPNGYVATIMGPLSMESDEGTAWSNPSSGEKAGIIAAPLAGLGIGAAIGALAAHNRQFYPWRYNSHCQLAEGFGNRKSCGIGCRRRGVAGVAGTQPSLLR